MRFIDHAFALKREATAEDRAGGRAPGEGHGKAREGSARAWLREESRWIELVNAIARVMRPAMASDTNE